jgi:sensor histidine kinase YesM
MVTNYVLEENTESSGRSGIGMKNIKRRLELLYQNCHDLVITNRDGKYTVNLKIYCN